MPLRQLAATPSRSAAFEAPMDRVAISYYRAPHSLTMRVRGTQRDAQKLDAASSLVSYRPLARPSVNPQASVAGRVARSITSREPPQRLADRASSRFLLADAPYLNFSSFHYSIPERIYARVGIKKWVAARASSSSTRRPSARTRMSTSPRLAPSRKAQVHARPGRARALRCGFGVLGRRHRDR